MTTELIQKAVHQQEGICPECSSTKLIQDYELAEIVCTGCGYVVKDNLVDRGAEWRAFNHEERAKRERTGAPLNLLIHDKGLSTFIDKHNTDVYGTQILKGKELEDGQKSQIYRLRKWQKKIRISESSERNLSQALSEIDKIGNTLSLPKNVLETASVIYRKAIKEGVVKGRSINGVSAASLYAACRQCGVVRTLNEFVQASDVNKNTLTCDYRTLIKRLDYYENIPVPQNNKYVTKISNHFGVKGKTEEIAHKALKAAKEDRFLSGKSPPGLAGSAFYIASILSGEKKIQKDIAEAIQVTEVTIRNRYKEMRDRLQFIISL